MYDSYKYVSMPPLDAAYGKCKIKADALRNDRREDYKNTQKDLNYSMDEGRGDLNEHWVRLRARRSPSKASEGMRR